MDTTNRSERRDRAQMECWSRTMKKIMKQNDWTSMQSAEWLLSRDKDTFNELLISGGGAWGKILKELGGAK